MAEAQRVAGRPCAGATVGPRARAPGSSPLMASQLRAPPPRVSAFPTVEQAQDGRRRTCRHPSSAQRWPQPCDPRCSPRGEGHVSSPAQAGLRAPTCADGGGQSVHESRERLAGGRGAVRGGRGAAQQVDPPRVLPELLQVPRQQAKLLALRPALLLQLPHPALRERRAQSAGAGRRGCTCEGERAVSVRAACHVCMWPVCMCRERARVHCGHLCACRGACVCAVVRVHVSCVGQAASSLHMEQRRVTPSLPHSLAVGQVPSQASVGKRRCQEAPPALGPQPAAARSGLRVQPGHLAVGMAPAAVRNRRVQQWHGPDSGTSGC